MFAISQANCTSPSIHLMKPVKTYIFLSLLLSIPGVLSAQFVPLENGLYNKLYASQTAYESHLQLGMKPFLIQSADSSKQLDESVFRYDGKLPKNNLLWRKIFAENLLRYRTSAFSITADPLFDFEVGNDLSNQTNTWVNTRGLQIEGNLYNKVFFNTLLYENQAVFAAWPDTFIRANQVVPGQGLVRGFKGKGFDYAYCNGYLTYMPAKYFYATVGYGKNFIGDGYRSLLLSDAAFSYPYLRLDFQLKNIHYSVLYDQYIDLRSDHIDDFGYNRKWSVMHYLQVQFWKKLNLGFFDAIVWENNIDSLYRGFDVQYINPVIFTRPQEFAVGSPDNAFVGATASFRFDQQILAYSQLLLDEFNLKHLTSQDGWWANKYSLQLGVAGFDIAKIKGLNARLEYNQVRPYTYAHNSSLQNYSHYNQPLAHPLGANFREVVAMADFTYHNWMARFKTTFAMYGADTAGIDFGQDIFVPYTQHFQELGNTIGQGAKTHLNQVDLSLSYLVNRRTNMKIEAGIASRSLTSQPFDQKTSLIYFGVKTNLRNLYYDF